MTEVLSVSSAASADKEVPGGGIRISADTIYRLRLISLALAATPSRRFPSTRCVEEYLESGRSLSPARDARVVVSVYLK